MNENKIYFVIDTDTYAGNFERDMCAYITGQTGDCGVGIEIANEVDSNYSGKMADLVGQESDENGCYRPCKIYPTPGYYNNGMGFSYKKGEEHVAIEKYAESCIEYSNKRVHPNNAEDFKKKWLDRATNAANKYNHYHSFQSVAICFNERPANSLIQTLKDRAKEFAKKYSSGKYGYGGGGKYKIDGFKIEGFRLITEVVVRKKEEI